ncbi:DUF397 domain-containing protein [Streptomyces sp. MCA2]|nr:DUF397 domain-containing protein [Streptomyces sp. MCA2]
MGPRSALALARPARLVETAPPCGSVSTASPRPEQAWRKSGYHSGGGNCIVATAFGAGTVAVHDAKNPAWTRPVRCLPR